MSILRITAPGSTVTGRIIDVEQGVARVELGEGIEGRCTIESAASGDAGGRRSGGLVAVELDAKSALEGAGPQVGLPNRKRLHAGQIRSFRIKPLEPDAKKIDLILM